MSREQICGAPKDGRACYPECSCETQAECAYGTIAEPSDPETRFIDGMGWVVRCHDAVKFVRNLLPAQAASSTQGVDRVDHALALATIDGLRTRLASCEAALEQRDAAYFASSTTPASGPLSMSMFATRADYEAALTAAQEGAQGERTASPTPWPGKCIK